MGFKIVWLGGSQGQGPDVLPTQLLAQLGVKMLLIHFVFTLSDWIDQIDTKLVMF